MKEIVVYKTSFGKCPYDIWFQKLDKTAKVRIHKRLERLQEGNYGDFKKIDNDIFELRFIFGGGYRIYFAEHGDIIVILLCGGDKSTQTDDIKKAKNFIQDLKERSL